MMDEGGESTQVSAKILMTSGNDDDGDEDDDDNGGDDDNDAEDDESEDDDGDDDDAEDNEENTVYNAEQHEYSGLISSDDESEDDHELSVPQFIDLQIICQILCRCRKLINIINSSSIIYNLVREMVGSNVKVDLVVDMKVRWGSTHTMVERIIQYRPALLNLFGQLPSLSDVTKHQRAVLQSLKLSDDEWSILESLSDILHVFVEATEMLSGNKYPSLAIAYDVLDSLQFYLNASSAHPVESSIKHALKQSFDKYIDRSSDSSQHKDTLIRKSNL